MVIFKSLYQKNITDNVSENIQKDMSKRHAKKSVRQDMPRRHSKKKKKKKKHVLKAWQGVRLARQVKSRRQNQSVKLLLPNTIVKKSRC